MGASIWRILGWRVWPKPGESTISSDVMLGTPQYISPEQASGRRDLDNGTDIYSFGILLYELLVGKVPYIADTPYSIIHDHIYAPLPMPRSIKPEIPEAVERILLRALAKERLDRFPDIAALLDAWHQAFLEPVDTLPPPSAVIDASVAPEGERLESSLGRANPPRRAPGSPMPDGPEHGSSVSEQAAAAIVPDGKVAKRNRPPGWMVAGIVLVIVCLCAGASILYSGARKNARQATLTVQALVPVLSKPTLQPVDTTYPLPYCPRSSRKSPHRFPPYARQNQIWSALQATGTLSQTGQIEAALAGVQQAPQSAPAYLDLAIAYGVQGMPEEAQKAFKTAVGLAAVPADFYELAGDRVAEREAWGLAATMYLEALERVPDPAPETLLNKINQSLYLAANAPEIQAILAKAPVKRLSPGIIDAVARPGSHLSGRGGPGAGGNPPHEDAVPG